MMCGMYIINGVHGPEPRSSGGNISSDPQNINRGSPCQNLVKLQCYEIPVAADFPIIIPIQWDYTTLCRNEGLTFRNVRYVR